MWQNYPNPFVQSTVIRYQLPVKAKVRLRIYDISGRMVKVLVNGDQTAGEYKVEWTTKGLTSGIYFVKLEAGTQKQVKKLILMK